MRLDIIFKPIRLAALVVGASVIAVIFLGRSGPVEPASLVQPASRKSSTPPFQWISSAFTALDPYGFRLLDLETGRLGTFSLPFEHGIDLVGVSPWVDGGHRQIVGLGWKQSGSWAERGGVGILRLSLPEGEILNWIPLAESLPASQLRWVPGATAAVVYAACDGQVYRIDFERSSADGHIEQLPEPKISRLTWQTPMPSAAGVVVEDIDYPDDPRLGGKILVSLRSMNAGTRHYGHSQIWWLQSDKDGTSIVAAGRLLEPAAETEPSDRRLPSLAGGAQNSTALLYFARVAGQPDYQLRVAPLRLDGARGIPQVREAESRIVATGCLPISGASPSGRWLFVVRRNGDTLNTERLVL